jgi:hypothetical protein
VALLWEIDVPSVDGHDQSVKNRSRRTSRSTKRRSTRSRWRLVDGGPNVDNTAIVSIAVGEKSRAFARLLVRSFQLHSEFAGPLYIATDDVEYFRTEAPDLSETGDDDDDSAKRRERIGGELLAAQQQAGAQCALSFALATAHASSSNCQTSQCT